MNIFKSSYKKLNLILVNYILRGMFSLFFPIKRKLLNSIRYKIEDNNKVVGLVECTRNLIIGKECWIVKSLKINGNGTVIIGDRCDIAPEFTFQTAGHLIGTKERSTRKWVVFNQNIGNGEWIEGRTKNLNNITIGNSSVIVGSSCVIKNIEENCLVGGVPSKLIRRFEND